MQGKLAGVQCDHEPHGCWDNAFAWIHVVNEFIFLENPKAGSTYVKNQIVKQVVEGQTILRDEIIQYPDFKVFGIYREPKDKMLSAFRDFTKRNDQMRMDQMGSLFNREFSFQEARELSFSDFLDLAIAHKDHHWSPNFAYLFLPEVPVTLFRYHPGVMSEVEDFLGLKVKEPSQVIPENCSPPYDREITVEEEQKVYQIMKLDYDNMNYFRERIINA